jgi:hypothetical protein
MAKTTDRVRALCCLLEHGDCQNNTGDYQKAEENGHDEPASGPQGAKVM